MTTPTTAAPGATPAASPVVTTEMPSVSRPAGTVSSIQATLAISVGEMRDQLGGYRPELRSTPEARDTARFILLSPPLPLVARGPYGVLGAAAVSLLPAWARWPLRVPYLPVTEAVAVRAAGTVVTRTIRWAMAPDQ